MNTTIIQTVLGPARLAAEQGALIGLWFRGQQHEPAMPPEAVAVAVDSDPTLGLAAEWLSEHLAGGRAAAMPKLAPRGTDFQQAVWKALLEIPAGQTTTYGALARSIGKPSATRAVAAAIGRNPVSVLIPCHRVIGSSGSLTGYAGGLGRKQALLTLESGAVLPWKRVARAYQAQYADPIEVDIGASVGWVERADEGEFPGWKWAVAADQRGGWVPRSYFGPGETQSIARRHYHARELSVAAGDQVLELDEFSGWISVIDRSGRCGWIPRSVLAGGA
ncbi:MAG: methylated-DNA--[protein]-cysteine S-methyltransferase [Lysobacterales bacterium]